MATAKKSRKPDSKKPTAKKTKGAKAAASAKSARAKAPKAGVAAKARVAKRASVPRRHAAAAKPLARSASRVVAKKVKIVPVPKKAAAPRVATKEMPVRKGRKLDLRSIKKDLMQRREDLLGKLSRLTTTSTDGDKPVGDRADDASFDLEVDSSYSIAEREAEELRFINVALDKIGNGTYGTCEECGGLIEGPRLKALPYAVMCLKCKQSDELQRQAPSTEVMYGRIEEE